VAKDVEVFTAENRPICKRCQDKKAALRHGELAYKGFCSSCYQSDKTERRAAESLSPQTLQSRPAKKSVQPAKPPAKPGESLANTRATLAGIKKLVKRPPGGYHHPKPAEGPAEGDEIRELPSKFGWCLTAHHQGLDEADLYPGGMTGLLAGTFPVTCPSVIWLSSSGEWLSCPCQCHKSPDSATAV
jgi:hypothetical protein